jgi:hypothetical protein
LRPEHCLCYLHAHNTSLTDKPYATTTLLLLLLVLPLLLLVLLLLACLVSHPLI